MRRDEIAQWLNFCTNKIDKIEKVWNKKLDETNSDDSLNAKDDDDNLDDKDSNDDDDDMSSHEKTINALLERSDFHRLSRSHCEKRSGDQVMADLQAAKDSLKPLSKDDSDAQNDLGAQEDFAHNNYWRAPEMHSIEDLMKELAE